MNETTAIFAAAVLQEAGRLANSRESESKEISLEDIRNAITNLEIILNELGRKNL